MTFRTPPASPPTGQSVLSGNGMRRVCSLEFSPHMRKTADTGLADTALVGGGPSPLPETITVPSSNLYRWSCGHFSRPLLEPPHDDDEEASTRREERERLSLDGIFKCQNSSKFWCLSFLGTRIAKYLKLEILIWCATLQMYPESVTRLQAGI